MNDYAMTLVIAPGRRIDGQWITADRKAYAIQYFDGGAVEGALSIQLPEIRTLRWMPVMVPGWKIALMFLVDQDVSSLAELPAGYVLPGFVHLQQDSVYYGSWPLNWAPRR